MRIRKPATAPASLLSPREHARAAARGRAATGCQVVAQAREGRILQSIPGIGATSAAAIIAAIGNIHNFETAAALKAYFGWAPVVTQTGVTTDRARLTRGGERTMKEIVCLAAMRGVREGGAWRTLYDRLVPRKCAYDERTRSYTGRMKVIARVAGQMTAMIYAFLKADAELLARTPPGAVPPDSMLYDPAIHQSHRAGRYRSMKPRVPTAPLVQLPQRDAPSSPVG
jgi:hypothetical protein